MEQLNPTPSGAPGEEIPTVEIEVDGQKQKFTHQELAEGLMRQKD